MSIRSAFLTGVDRYNMYGPDAAGIYHEYEGREAKAYRAGIMSAFRKKDYESAMRSI